MADSSPGQGPSRGPRPRAQSEATRPRPNEEQQGNLLSPTWSLGTDRRTSSAQTPGQGLGPGLSTESSGLRPRRSQSNRVPSLTSRTTLARRTQGNFTLAGPDETSALRQAHEPFVHPVYADLNPSYEQPNNATPLWSLAKPLPRVVRPGMVPTKDEVLQNRMGERPAVPGAENSQKLGMEDVDPNELEAGRIGKSADPRKMMAGVDDARAQRENNFVNKLLTGETGAAAGGSRMSRTSSTRRRSSAAAAPAPAGDQLSAVFESENSAGVSPERRHDLSDEPLQAVPEEHEHEHEHELGEEYDLGNDINDHLNFNESAYPEDLHPLVQDLVEDEVHNNHTVWSVIRTHHREALAESLGVFVQLSIGLSADLSVTLPATANPNTTAWAWGLGTMMAIYISGGVSGAHLNPSISSMLWFYRGFPKRKLPEYFAAQFLGAFVAALAVYGLYYQSINEYLSTPSSASATVNVMNSFVTNQRNPWITSATAFFNEFFGTVLLSITVLALGDDQNAPPGAGMNALVVGLSVYTLSITFSYQTGAAFNPSRDFGPRLALLAMGYGGDLFLDPYWFYGPWAGSFCGAFIGGFLYDFMIFTGGESPVNYPLERTKRAMRRKKMKWKRRLRLEKKVDNAAL